MKWVDEHYRSGKNLGMEMRRFLDTSTRDEIGRVATEARTKVIYLRQIGCGAKRPSPQLARRLEAASHGVLLAAELRPDVFGPISTSNSPAIRDCP